MLIYGDKTGAETINDYLMGRDQNSWKSFALFPPYHTNTNTSIGTYKFKTNTKRKNNDNKIKSKPAHMLHCHIKQIKYKYKYKFIQLQDSKKTTMTKWGRLLTNSPLTLVLQTNAACLKICFDVCAQSLTAVKSTDSILLFFSGHTQKY